jgi:hypothetical protein
MTNEELRYKVCMNKLCSNYNMVVHSQATHCPFCREEYTYPVPVRMPRERW